VLHTESSRSTGDFGGRRGPTRHRTHGHHHVNDEPLQMVPEIEAAQYRSGVDRSDESDGTDQRQTAEYGNGHGRGPSAMIDEPCADDDRYERENRPERGQGGHQP